MTEKQQRIFNVLMAAILIASMYFVAREGAVYISSTQVEEIKQPCVVIDAGHGGRDPGKVGVNGSLEKDINLKIALQLRDFLEANDIRVVLTREDDQGLYSESASNKKVEDMRARLDIIEKETPVLVVSIHQNSYREEYVSGAQVFYYRTSQTGKKLAAVLQERLIQDIDLENHRQPKGNDNYYLLQKTTVPIVVIECGFLSNIEEEEKLSTAFYQEKLAWSIHMGIMQFINSQ